MNIYIAKQPIFNRKNEVAFYELLFRASKENVYSAVDGDEATYQVISNTFLSMGIEKITGDKRAFINFTEKLILNETAMMLPKDLLGIEILENIMPTREIISACKKMKQKGYMLVLDDFEYKPGYQELIDMADVIKIDFMATKGEERRTVIERYGNKDMKFLAEKVETMQDYLDALEYGYEYFQGYFFSKPQIVSERDIPVNNKFKYEILRVAFNDDARIETLENVIKRDVSLSYKLLKLVNSAYFGFEKNITSIREAVMIMGLKEIKKWIILLTVKEEKNDFHDEILSRSVVRARLGELVAEKTGYINEMDQIFLMELISETDTILNKPLDEILDGLALDEKIKEALSGVNNDLGILHQLLHSYQNAQWDKFDIFSKMINLQGIDISELYFEAIRWSKEIFE